MQTVSGYAGFERVGCAGVPSPQHVYRGCRLCQVLTSVLDGGLSNIQIGADDAMTPSTM